LHDVHDVTIQVGRVDPVHAHADRLAVRPPVVGEQAGDHVAPGLLLVGGGDRVLEVEEHVVGVALQRLAEQRRLRAGHGELAALQPHGHRVGPREAHARTAARADALPAGCCASGDCGTGPRAASGAAVLRLYFEEAATT